MSTYAGTRYRTIQGKRWSMSWKLMGTTFTGTTWKPTTVVLALRLRDVFRKEEYDWMLNGKPCHPGTFGSVWQKTGRIIEVYDYRDVWREVFHDIDAAAAVYQRFLKKDFDDLRMMELL